MTPLDERMTARGGDFDSRRGWRLRRRLRDGRIGWWVKRRRRAAALERGLEMDMPQPLEGLAVDVEITDFPGWGGRRRDA